MNYLDILPFDILDKIYNDVDELNNEDIISNFKCLKGYNIYYKTISKMSMLFLNLFFKGFLNRFIENSVSYDDIIHNISYFIVFEYVYVMKGHKINKEDRDFFMNSILYIFKQELTKAKKHISKYKKKYIKELKYICMIKPSIKILKGYNRI